VFVCMQLYKTEQIHMCVIGKTAKMETNLPDRERGLHLDPFFF
jgi:hypothetical protein